METSARNKGARIAPWVAETTVALALLVVALTVRLPFLEFVPPLWDSEMSEALEARGIALGSELPLVVPSQPHLGPVAIYPLALVLKFVSFDPFTPRRFIAFAGALTAVAAFGLTRVLAGRWTALIAGGLVAANSLHIVINSHVFWTNSLTPLLTTLALAALMASVGPRAAPKFSARTWLVLAGLLWGLALQSHPSVAALLPGMVLGIALNADYRANLRAAWTWLAPGAGILAYANMIVFNVTHNMESVSVLLGKGYALPGERALWLEYPARLGDLMTELVRVVSSNPDALFPLNPMSVLFGMWCAGAIVLSLVKRRTLLVYPFLSGALLIALFNKAYNFAEAERYIMYLLPLAAATVALAVRDVWTWARPSRPSRSPKTSKVSDAVSVLGLALCALLILSPLPALADYYAREMQAGASNQAYVPWSQLAKRYANTRYRVRIDRGLDRAHAVLNAGGIGTTLAYMFRMNKVETEVVPDAEIPPPASGTLVAAVRMNLERTGYEESQRQLVVCVVEHPTVGLVTLTASPSEGC